jgi:hypothetical protein
MVFTVFGAVVELERSLIAERVRAGLRNARAKGKSFGRPRAVVDAAWIARLRAQVRMGGLRTRWGTAAVLSTSPSRITSVCVLQMRDVSDARKFSWKRFLFWTKDDSRNLQIRMRTQRPGTNMNSVATAFSSYNLGRYRPPPSGAIPSTGNLVNVDTSCAASS